MQGFGSYEMDRDRRCYRPDIPSFPKLEDVWQMLDRANKSVEAFDRALDGFPVPGVIGKLFARLDAVHSSGAEGCTTTFTDLMEYQTALKRAKNVEDAREVFAAAEAFDGFALSDTSPLQITLNIHRRFFHDSSQEIVRNMAGHWKQYPNGVFDKDIGGSFYYCSPASMAELLPQWEALTMDQDDQPELLRQALSHWLFEHIHPVHDGNGRIGRLLVPFVMRQKGALKNASAFLGEAVHFNKEIYVDALKSGRIIGDFGPWCRIFCSMIMQTANSNSTRLEKLGEVRNRWLTRTKGVRSHSVVHELVPWVMTKPTFTVKDALELTGNKVSFQAMNTAIKRLQDLEIVRMAGASGGERLFVADDVMKLFEPPPPTLDLTPPTPGYRP